MRILHLFYQEKKYGGSETFFNILKSRSQFEHSAAHVVKRGAPVRVDQTAHHFISGFKNIIADIAEKSDCDVLQAHFFIPAYLAQKARIPTVLISHCLLSEEFRLAVHDFADQDMQHKTSEAYTIFRKCERLWYPKITHVVTLSRFHTKELNHLQTNATFIHPILDTDTFSIPLDKHCARENLNLDDIPTLLFMARPTYYKGLHVLLEAFTLLKREFKELQVVIVGENFGKSAQSVGYLPAVSGTSPAPWTFFHCEHTNSVAVRNDQESSVIPSYFRAADIVVCPSLYESFGYVNLEALASGTPVVASCTGGIPEIIQDGHTGLLFEKGNPKDLEEKVGLLLRDEPLRIRLAANGLKEIRKYDAQEGVKRLDALYEEVAAHG